MRFVARDGWVLVQRAGRPDRRVAGPFSSTKETADAALALADLFRPSPPKPRVVAVKETLPALPLFDRR